MELSSGVKVRGEITSIFHITFVIACSVRLRAMANDKWKMKPPQNLCLTI
jgi:hypothetical protein